MRTLSEKTKISIGLAATVIGGGAMWLTSMHFQAQANTSDIVVIKADQKEISAVIHRIDKRLSNIETALDVEEQGDE